MSTQRPFHFGVLQSKGNSESTTDGDGGSDGDGDGDVVSKPPALVVNITPARNGTIGLLLSGGSDIPNQPLVLVKEISAGSPAELSKLRRLDQVLEINGTRIESSTSHRAVINMVRQAVVTGSVQLVVARAVLGRSPCQFSGNPALQLSTAPFEMSLRKHDGKFGFTIRTIDGGNPRVAHVVPGSPAACSHLQVGQMIMEINGMDVAGLGHHTCMELLSSSSDHAHVTVVPNADHGEYLRRCSQPMGLQLDRRSGYKKRAQVCWCFDPIPRWESYIVSRYLVLLVIAIPPWIWPLRARPVSLASDPTGSNMTAGGSCLDPGSDNYLDCCDEYGVALKPYWIFLTSALIFAFLLGTTKNRTRLENQIRAETPLRWHAKDQKRKAAKKRGFCCQWMCCVSRLPFDCWARCPVVTWFDCWVKAGKEAIKEAKTTEIAAKNAEAEMRASHWTRGCCGYLFKNCCGDEGVTSQENDSGARFGCCQVHERSSLHEDDKKMNQTQEIREILDDAVLRRDRWVWFIVGIQLLVAVVSTWMIVIDLRARGLQGWDLYQAATLLSFNSTLGSFLAAAMSVSSRALVQENQSWLTKIFMTALVPSVPSGKEAEDIWKRIRCDLPGQESTDSSDHDVSAIFDAVFTMAMWGAGGIGFCAGFTHIGPGLFMFLPYIAAGFAFAALFGVIAGATLSMPFVAFGIDYGGVPEGTILKSAGEALASTVWILVATGSVVTAVTVSVQYYAGVPWGQAIVNDWTGRTSAKYVGCLVQTFSGTAPNVQSKTISWTDFIGVVL